MTDANERDYTRPVFSEELFQSFYPMICQIIRKETAGMRMDSDMIDDFDDLVQRCRIWLWEHIEKYEPIRYKTDKDGKVQIVKTKFSSFMYMVFTSRVGSVRDNHKKKTKNRHVINFTDYKNVRHDDDISSENEISFLSKDQSLLLDKCEIEQHLNFIRNQVSDEDYLIFEEYFINECSANDIFKKYPNFKYNEVRKIVKKLTNSVVLGV
jgi:DNA-directed RNA polymerase specialized sigma subunit